MCGVSLKGRKHNEVLYRLLGIKSVAEVVNRGCRNVEVAGERCVGRDRKSRRECVGVCSLNGQGSGICGETSFRGQTSNPS